MFARRRALGRPASKGAEGHGVALRAPAYAQMRAPEYRSGARLLRTSNKHAWPSSCDACSAKAKQVSARDRAALSKLVRGERPHRLGGNDCIHAESRRHQRLRSAAWWSEKDTGEARGAVAQLVEERRAD